jgi:hypothetical protein
MAEQSFTVRDTRITAHETGFINYLHTVLFSFHASVPPSDRAFVIASILTQADAPGMESMVISPNLLHDADPSAWEWVLMLDFATEHRSVAFQASTLHQKQIKEGFEPFRSGFVMLDLHQPFDRKTADAGGNEIRETLFFNFKPELPEAERTLILAEIQAETGQPCVSRVVTGKNSFAGSAKPKFSFLDYQIIREFKTEADWTFFKQSEAQKAFMRDVFGPAVDGAPVGAAIRMSGPHFHTKQQVVPR